MRLRLFIYVLLYLLCVTSAYGQGRFSFLESVGHHVFQGQCREIVPEFTGWQYEDVAVLDTARVSVMYDVDLIADTLGMVKARDRVKTLIGSHTIQSFGYGFWCLSKPNSMSDDDILKLSSASGLDGYKVIINWFVYRELEKRMVRNRHVLPLRRSIHAIEYEESQPTFKWVISDETQKITGYQCQKAETDYAGRHWSVWFTPELPIDCGLWKFSGLPGLIMKAEDSEGFYRFTCASIENTDECIELSRTVKPQTLTRASFRKIEKQSFASPIQTGMLSRQGFMIGRHLSVETESNEFHTIYPAENYLNLYFPMELE